MEPNGKSKFDKANKNLILYTLGVLLSKIGDKIYLLAMPWLVYDLTGSALGMGTMFLVETIPFVFISPIAGILADQFSRKKLLCVAVSIQSLSILSVILLNAFHLLEVYHVYIFGFILASAGATFMVVHETIIPQLFKREKLVKVNSLFQFMETSTLLVGSALAGILIAIIGVFGVLGIVSFAYGMIVLSILGLSFTKTEKPKTIQGTSFQQFTQGLKYVKNHKIVGPLVLLTVVVNIANAAMMALLMFYARDQLGLSSQQIGWIYGIGATSQIICIIVVSRLNVIKSPLKIMLACQLISSIGIVWIASSWSWQLVGIGLALQNGPTIIYNVLNRSLRQRIVPSNMLGRVNGVIMMLGQASFPLSGFIGGLLAEVFNVQFVLLGVGGFVFLVVTLFWFSPLRKIRNVDDYSRNAG